MAKAPRRFYSKVAGTSHENSNGYSRQKIIKNNCKRGMSLILKREPDNPHDSDAIAVWINARGCLFSKKMQIGYIESGIARDLSDKIDMGRKVEAKIEKVTGGTKAKETLGVNIELFVYD